MTDEISIQIRIPRSWLPKIQFFLSYPGVDWLKTLLQKIEIAMMKEGK